MTCDYERKTGFGFVDKGWWKVEACDQCVQFGIWKLYGVDVQEAGRCMGLAVLSTCEQENQNEIVKCAKLSLGAPFYFRTTLGPQFPNFFIHICS